MNEIEQAPNGNIGPPDPNIASLIHIWSYVTLKMFTGLTVLAKSWKKEPLLKERRKSPNPTLMFPQKVDGADYLIGSEPLSHI